MSEWKETALSEVIDLIGGGTPKTSIAEYWGGDIPWLSVADFNTGQKYVRCTEKISRDWGWKKAVPNSCKRATSLFRREVLLVLWQCLVVKWLSINHATE
jgi:Type I restriction modification DNA specificity domain.